MNDANKMHHAMPRGLNFKLENNQEIDGNIKTKKIKLDKDQHARKAVDVTSSRVKNNIKNTYINKINSLIVDQKVDFKAEENKMYALYSLKSLNQIGLKSLKLTLRNMFLLRMKLRHKMDQIKEE